MSGYGNPMHTLEHALPIGPRHAPGAACQTNYCATNPLDLQTNGRTTPIHTNGHRGPAPLESKAGFMNYMMRLRSGVELFLLGSSKHCWIGQLGPRHPSAPARACSHGATLASANPGWSWWKAETTAGQARTDRALDVDVMRK